MSPVAPSTPLRLARNTVRRANLRRSLRAAAAGASRTIEMDLGDQGLDAVEVVVDFTHAMRTDSGELLRLNAVFRNSGIADRAVSNLAAKSAHARRDGAMLLGALRMPYAASWLEPLLRSKNRSLAEAGARALSRIGGHRSAEALLGAIRRSGLRRILVTELAHAAPDLFLEVHLSEEHHPNVTAAAAIAAGLRRRQTAIAPLIALLSRGNPRERAISCRALGWIGSPVAAPAVRAVLNDPEWKVRLAATKALADLQAGYAYIEIYNLRADASPRVREAARSTLRRLGRSSRQMLS